MKSQYRKIGRGERIVAAILALLLLPGLPLSVGLLLMDEWVGAAVCVVFGILGVGMVYAVVTGKSPEHLKDLVHLGVMWPGGG